MSIALIVGDNAWVDTKLMKGKDTLSAFGKAMAFPSPLVMTCLDGTVTDIIYGMVGAGPLVTLQGLRTALIGAYTSALAAKLDPKLKSFAMETVLRPYMAAKVLGLISPTNMMDVILIGHRYNFNVIVDEEDPRILAYVKTAILGAGTGGIVARRAMTDEGYTPLRAVYAGCYSDRQASGGMIEQWGLAWPTALDEELNNPMDLRFEHLGLAHSRTPEVMRDIMAHATEPMAMDLVSQRPIALERPRPELETVFDEELDEETAIGMASRLATTSPSPRSTEVKPASSAVPARRKKSVIHTFFKRRLYKE